MSEPIDTVATGGRPSPSEKQFQIWLDALEGFLKKGGSLYYCCGMAGIDSHYDVILRKYNSNDWFSKKVDAFRATPGDAINDGIVTMALNTVNKIKTQQVVMKDELDMLKFAAEKLRVAQPFFVNRQETAEVDPNKIGKVIDTIEASDYDELASQIDQQGVATNPPVQNQGQDGAAGSVQAQPNPNPPHQGTGEPSVQ